MALVKYNVKNVKYAIPANGSYSSASIKPLGKVSAISLDSNYSEQPVFADGEVYLVLPSDKGKTGSLTMVALENDYEVAMGRKVLTADGNYAEVQQLSTIEHAIYFETNGVDSDEKVITIKNWLLDVRSGRPKESFSQKTENVNINNIEIPIQVLGVYMKNNTGTVDYVDENGNTRKVTIVSAQPGDTNFDTFGNTVPIPKMPD